MDYARLRSAMVKEQLIPRGIANKAVLSAFLDIERHRFIPEDSQDIAYGDFPVPIGENQTISQPYIVALMTECLNLTGEEKVLEIGTGSGYQTAILAKLCKEICTMERFGSLARRAEKLFNELGYNNIKIKTGDGTLGWPEECPFDRVIITAAAPEVPAPLMEQLKEGGRMVLPLGESSSQTVTIVEKINGKAEKSGICGCVFVPLVGKYGWEGDNA